MHQPSHAIGKKNINLLWFNDGGYFAQSKTGMKNSLSGSIGSGLFIRCAWRRVRTSTCEFSAALE
jgi:hypothetical protein